VRNPPPKKGLITDLDETLWKGILGEIGSEGISWDLDNHSQIHGLYQQLLRSLAASGTLIAVASRNDPKLVEQAFGRRDIVLQQENVFPFEVHWGAKSESVARILAAWNVSADSVVFVDDSPMDLAEVKTGHPALECLLFPGEDYQAVYVLLERLRDWFGKDRISEEDSLRAASLRARSSLQLEGNVTNSTPGEFQRKLAAKLTLSFQKLPADPRAFELVNKTNQFNLNGRRYQETEWHHWLRQEDTVLLTVNYTDKYGPLGKVVVLSGRLCDGNRSGKGKLCVQTWVMSCRAFSRLIEYMCLQYLFSKLDIEDVEFNFVATDRNRPMHDFLRQLPCQVQEGNLCVSRLQFANTCPPLSHAVEEIPNG
jgi:FkbH-like protein